MHRAFSVLLLTGLYLLCPLALAQTVAPARSPAAGAAATAPQAAVTQPVVTGKTLDGQAFDLAKLKGSVVMLMFWSTECAICRDKMPEMRENAKGWAGKPFRLVLVSADKRMADVDSYNAIVNKAVPIKERLPQVWALDSSYKDNLGTVDAARTKPASHWPIILVLDKTGKTVTRHQGRMPADVWDDVAGLL
jgi:thiol-disulfide isomerase/thioredoxin